MRQLATILVCVILAACARPGPLEVPPLPTGAEWQGVYQGSDLIFLRILTEGSTASGEWRATGLRHGELQGKVLGNLLDYSWTETSLKPGNVNTSSGRGYFVYRVTPAGHEIIGRASRGKSEIGQLRLARKRFDVPVDASEETFFEPGGTEGDDDSPGCSGCSDDVDTDTDSDSSN